MPLVFVHGVNNRMTEEYKQAERERNALFSRLALRNVLADPDPQKIVSPYWGSLASVFAWNHGCLPGKNTERFGQEDDPVEAVVEELGIDSVSENDSQFLLDLAKRDFPRAVDLLFAATAVDGDSTADETEFAELADAASQYAENHPRPDWLHDGNVNDDLGFVDELSVRVDEWIDIEATETFGVGGAWNRVTTAAHRVRDAAGQVWKRGKEKLAASGSAIGDRVGDVVATGAGALTNPFVRTTRPKLHLRFAYFVGDVLVYINGRGTRGNEGKIVTKVADAIEDAAKKATPEDPLILVAHSMGGPICYDILTHFRPQLNVDLLVTVGSQVAFFEEAKLYRESSDGYSAAKNNRVPQPSSVKKWINVFDSVDPVGFAVEKVFDGPKDFEWATKTHVGSAHSFYFVRPSFHRRLGVRIKEALA